jgi:MFS family permease
LLVAWLEQIARARDLNPYVLPWVIVPIGAISALVAVTRVRPDPRSLAVSEGFDTRADARVPRELLRLSSFRAAVLAGACAQTAMVAVMGVTPPALHSLHHGGAAISLVISFHIASMWVFSPWIGRLADQIGRRAVLMGGCAISAMGALLAATEASAAVIGVGVFGLGLGWSATFLASTALISDITEPSERAGALGFLDLLLSASAAAAGLLSGAVLEVAGFRVLGISMAFLVAAVIALVHRTREPERLSTEV